MPKTASVTSSLTRGLTQDLFKTSSSSTFLDSLGITPRIAVSMTRKLVGSYSGDFYATTGSVVTTVYDQSGNGTNLTNDGTTNATLSGSGDSARAVFASSGYTTLTTSTQGNAFAAGTYDVFIAFDPVSTDKQMFFSRGSVNDDRITAAYNSTSDVFAGVTSGDVRVNDSVLSPQTRGSLYSAAVGQAGVNVISVEDLDFSTMGGFVMLGAKHNTWRAEGDFAEFIVTPSLSDADHSAIVANIQDFYS